MNDDQSRPRRRALLWLCALLLCVFAIIQITRPAIPKPPVTAEIQAPPAVRAILRNSCYNCHSNDTHLSLFDQPVPVYYLVRHDVLTARQHLNFSEIGSQPAAKQKAALYEAVNFIQLGAMPLPQYTVVHHGAILTPDQINILRTYLAPPPLPAAKPDDIAAADLQFTQSIAPNQPPVKVADELNGVPFLPDYKNWHEISATDRFDNNSMRVILGNDIAIKAIADNHINPWPDGTAFAKVTFHTQPDATGFVQTGAFAQVELMIRDSQKYKSSANWGFGRWLGPGLKPYGKDSHFTGECVSCHQPVAKNDYVYTMPLHQSGGAQ